MSENDHQLAVFDEVVSSLLNAEVSPERYASLTSISRGVSWADAVEVQRPNKRNELSNRIKDHDRFNGLISRHLAHIIVNPSKRTTLNDALIECYVHDEEHAESLNSSEGAISQFLDSAIRDAKENLRVFNLNKEGEESIERFRTKKTLRLLTGNRGVGKTFFLNHVLAKYSPRLDDEKVVWVRVNLVADFGDNSKLEHWMYAQATKILLRYYSTDSPLAQKKPAGARIDFRPALDAYCESRRAISGDAHGRALDTVERMNDVFVNNNGDETVSPVSIPESLARFVWNYAASQGFAFIVALDGFDRLESTAASGAKFSTLVTAVGRLIRSTVVHPCVLLLTLRTKTARQLALIETGPYASEPAHQYQISSASFTKIFRARLQFLLVNLTSEAVAERCGLSRQEAEAQLTQFRDTVERDLPEFVMFGDNLRAAMQALQLRHRDFITQGPDQQQYRWIESMMKAGFTFPPKISEYWPGESKETPFDFHLTTDVVFDNRLLPSVYSYPFHKYGSNPTIVPRFENVLLGARIIQLVGASDRLHRSGSISGRITVDILKEIVECLFPAYSGTVVTAQIRDFIELDVVDAENRSMSHTNLPNVRIQALLTAKGKYIREHCLREVAYLGLAAMRIPLDARMLTLDSDDMPPLFWAGEFVTGGNSPLSYARLVDWVSAKAINAINLCKLLRYVDGLQISRIRSDYDKIERKLGSRGFGPQVMSWRMKIVDGFLDEHPKLFADAAEHLRIQLLKMIESVVPTDPARSAPVDELERKLRWNGRLWGIDL